MDAMSPMFFGGLTARAMGLKKNINGMGNRLVETYPRKLVQLLNLPESKYRTDLSNLEIFVDQLVHTLGVSINKNQVTSWHHLDALLAFISGVRYLEKKTLVYGSWEEGEVYV